MKMNIDIKRYFLYGMTFSLLMLFFGSGCQAEETAIATVTQEATFIEKAKTMATKLGITLKEAAEKIVEQEKLEKYDAMEAEKNRLEEELEAEDQRGDNLAISTGILGGLGGVYGLWRGIKWYKKGNDDDDLYTDPRSTEQQELKPPPQIFAAPSVPVAQPAQQQSQHFQAPVAQPVQTAAQPQPKRVRFADQNANVLPPQEGGFQNLRHDSDKPVDSNLSLDALEQRLTEARQKEKRERENFAKHQAQIRQQLENEKKKLEQSLAKKRDPLETQYKQLRMKEQRTLQDQARKAQEKLRRFGQKTMPSYRDNYSQQVDVNKLIQALDQMQQHQPYESSRDDLNDDQDNYRNTSYDYEVPYNRDNYDRDQDKHQYPNQTVNDILRAVQQKSRNTQRKAHKAGSRFRDTTRARRQIKNSK